MTQEHIQGYPFYTFYAPDSLTDRIRKRVKTEIKFDTVTVNDDRSPAQSGYVYDNDAFTCFYDEELYSWLYDCLNPIYKTHFLFGTNCKIVDLWVTKASFLTRSEYHTHTWSVFSGLFYLQDSKTYTSFRFDDRLDQQWAHFTWVKPQQIEYRSESVKGKLVIWPSMVRHAISMHKEKTDRYTVAFNSFWDSSISQQQSGLLHMKTTQANELSILTKK